MFFFPIDIIFIVRVWHFNIIQFRVMFLLVFRWNLSVNHKSIEMKVFTKLSQKKSTPFLPFSCIRHWLAIQSMPDSINVVQYVSVSHSWIHQKHAQHCKIYEFNATMNVSWKFEWHLWCIHFNLFRSHSRSSNALCFHTLGGAM